MTDRFMPRRALISVSDKKGIEDFAKDLAALGIELISTGGTARMLRSNGLDVRDVSDITGFPEMMDGRVKTLHPAVHGGILGRFDREDHRKAAADHGIAPIDLLVVNLYPFENTVAGGADFADCVEQIDIGGPAMVRSAAKNHERVTVVTDPDDYKTLITALKAGGTDPALRRQLAAKAFARTAQYDAAISRWFAAELEDTTPELFSLAGTKIQNCRYGENPHQAAAFYATGDKSPGVASAVQHQGKALSYNNIADTDAAFDLICDIAGERPAVAIIKHANPCGVALGDSLQEAYNKALLCDPVSAFGGIVAMSAELDAETAQDIVKIFTEVIIAPAVSAEALDILAAKKNLRLLTTGGLADPRRGGLTVRTLSSGFLMQERDAVMIGEQDLQVVTKRKPTDGEVRDMLFAFRVAKHVKSNAIVYARDGMTVGVGAGQMNRRDSSRIAALRAAEAAEMAGESESFAAGSVVASDAFFPFADGLIAAVEAGATAVIQPGGSMRDDEVIAAADEAGIAMVFTGCRHFRH